MIVQKIKQVILLTFVVLNCFSYLLFFNLHNNNIKEVLDSNIYYLIDVLRKLEFFPKLTSLRLFFFILKNWQDF